MVALRPVRAWHPAPSDATADRLVCPVYDTLSDAELDRFASSSPFNAAGFVPRPRSLDLEPFLARARSNLAAALAAGAYVQDATPSYYVYGIQYVPPPDIVEALDLDQRRPEYLLLGLVGALDVDRLPHGQVALHERTFPIRVEERVALTDATGKVFAPILAGYHAPDHRLNDRLESFLGIRRRGLEFEGTRPAIVSARLGSTLHRLWRVDDPAEIAELRSIVEPLRLLILDGHHRFTAAARRTYEGRPTAPLVMIVDGTDRALLLLPWHRVVPAEVMTPERLIDAGRGQFSKVRDVPDAADVRGAIERLHSMRAGSRRGFVLITGDRAVEFNGAASDDAGADFDQLHQFLNEALEIDGERLQYVRSPRAAIESARGEHDGRRGSALLLPGLTTKGVEARAFERAEVMAEKSTMFLPKVAEGMLFAPAGPDD
jgi:uncharacterized protein (DUF1015 family)